MTSAAAVETVALAPGYVVPRLIVGGWQASTGHRESPLDRDRLFEDWAGFADAGLTAFDCADIYGGVEDLLGQFRAWYRNQRGAAAAETIRIHTKFVPDRDALPTISRSYVERIVDRSLRRLQAERLDLLQFHWWDYGVPRYVETAGWLDELRRAGKIRFLGATNFDTARLTELLESGVPFLSHQVQYSLLDRRPERGMAELCARHGVKLLCYGTVAGGFLSDRYQRIPDPQGIPENRSLVKYRLIIEEMGGWTVFQELLAVLAAIAGRHGVGIAAVATRWVLDRTQVGAAIVGARTGAHRAQSLEIFRLRLDQDDIGRLNEFLARHPGPTGDVYGLERAPGSRHAAIMRYDLNARGGVS